MGTDAPSTPQPSLLAPPAGRRVHAVLRDDTRALHTASEEALGLGYEQVPFEVYTHALAALHSVYAGLLQSFGELTHALDDVRHLGEKRLALHVQRLTQDMAFWGVAPWRPAPGLDPRWGSHHALGALYVVEGSTLGGQVLTPRLTERLRVVNPRVGNDSGLRFFHGDGAETFARWRAFLRLLAQHTVEECQIGEALLGAQKVFGEVLAAANAPR